MSLSVTLPENFAATRWTLVARASGADPAAQAALSELCAAYYAPVIAFLRARGRDEDTARELAHAFFEKVLAGGALGGADPARGRFRSYLLGAVKHFLADRFDRAQAAKRGSGEWRQNPAVGMDSRCSGRGRAGLWVADALAKARNA